MNKHECRLHIIIIIIIFIIIIIIIVNWIKNCFIVL